MCYSQHNSQDTKLGPLIHFLEIMSVTYKLFDKLQDEPLAELGEGDIGPYCDEAYPLFEQLWEEFKTKRITNLYHVWLMPTDDRHSWSVVLSYDGDYDELLVRPLRDLESDWEDQAGLLAEMVQAYYDQEHPDFEGMRVVIERNSKKQKTKEI